MFQPAPPSASGRRPARPSLEERYASLSRRYEALVQKYQSRTMREVGVYQLAWWALRSRTSAVALLEGGRMVFSNRTWTELDKGLTGGLRRLDAPGPPYPSLRALVDAEIHSLPDEANGPRLCRCEHRGSGRVLQLHLEHAQRLTRSWTFVLALDVTEQARRERELVLARAALEQRARLQALGELASGVAHDFNNAFFALKLRMESLARELEGPQQERVHELLHLLTEEGRRITRLQGLAQRHAEAPSGQVDLAAVVADAVELVRPSLEQQRKATGAHVEVAVRLGALPRVPGSAVDLRHVFLNLLLNARDAMPGGGRVEVSGRRARGGVVVEVADRGAGIRPEHLPRLYDLFFTTKLGKGTGVGLAMAAGVMGRLGGRIAAANRRGGGAVFRLHFPAADRAERPRPPAPLRAGLRVLVVDDEPDVREGLRLALPEQRVEAVGTGEEALARVRAGAGYDVALCDLGLPGMDGWAVAEALRRLAPGLPVYLISGWANEIDRADPRLRRVAGLLPKPLGISELEEALARALPRRVG